MLLICGVLFFFLKAFFCVCVTKEFTLMGLFVSLRGRGSWCGTRALPMFASTVGTLFRLCDALVDSSEVSSLAPMRRTVRFFPFAYLPASLTASQSAGGRFSVNSDNMKSK